MVRQGLMQTVSREPADGDIHLRFPHQPTVVSDAQQKAREHQSNRHLGVDARPAVTVTVQTSHFLTQPGQIEHPVHPRQKVVVGDQLTQRTTDEQLQLTALLAPQHLVASPTQATTILSKESRPCGFFNSPTRQRCQVAPRTRIIAAFSPSWASEITSLMPARPRALRLFRKSDQNTSASDGPMCKPTISRRPSVLTATAIIAATETIRPAARTFR